MVTRLPSTLVLGGMTGPVYHSREKKTHFRTASMHVRVDVVTTPNRPLRPSVDEMWKTFATNANGKDPLRTITPFEVRAAREMNVLVPAPPSAPVTVADLPSMPVMNPSTGQGKPATSDF